MPPPSAAPAPNPLEFTPKQDLEVSGLANAVRMMAVVLMFLMAARFGRAWLEPWANFPVIILYAIEALLCGFLGLVLISVSSDIGYITTTEGNDRIHLFNAVDSLNVFTKVVLSLGIVVVVVEILRLLF